MSSVSSVNPGLTQLLQTLSNVGSPLLSSPQAMAAIEKAPAGDIVKLSQQAMQLQNMDAMFGNTASTADTSATASDPLLSALYGAGSTGASTASTDPLTSLEQALSSSASPTDALATYARNMQLAESQSLFGTSTDTTSSSPVFG